jgi:ribonuclease HI
MIHSTPTVSSAAPLPYVPTPTNQRAELTALLEAIRWLDHQHIPSATIYTDSNYAIQCTSKWGPGWKRAGWKRSSGEPLQNLDLVKPLVDLWKPQWRLQHVYGHQKDSSAEAYGNNWVDRAAVEAGETKTVLVPRMYVSVPLENTVVVVPPVKPKEKEKEKEKEKPKGTLIQQDIRSWFGAK